MKTKLFTIAIAFMAISLSAQVNRPMPVAKPAPTVNLGKPSEFVLKNGLKVIVVENHKLPRVSATLTIDNPPLALSTKKGAESLLGELLGTGTLTMSKDDFNQKIEFVGANVNFWDNGASVSSLSKYFNEVAGYMADGIINPNFTQKEFDDVKARYIESLKGDEKSVEAAAGRMRRVLVYGANHPFAEYDTPETIAKITLQDVKDVYNAYYRPDNAYLIVVGDIKTNDVKKLVEKNLGKWKKGNVAIPSLTKIEEVKKTQIDIVNMSNAVQSVVSVAYPVYLTKKDPDYYAVQVASTILGGDFNSKLNMNLREAHGWTYGARGGVSDSRFVGQFSASATVRNNVTDSAVVETLKEMKSMTFEKVDQKVLEDVKAKFLGNFVLSLENPATVASQALQTKTNQLPSDFYANYLKNINAVTVDDVLRVSKKYFRPEQARIIVTGKAEEIAPGLEKLGYPVFFYDSYGKSIEKPVAAIQATTTTVNQIVANYTKAIGGDQKVKAVKTTLQNGTISMSGMSGEYTSKAMTPNKSYTAFTIMGMKIEQVFDGKKAYAVQAGQRMDLPAEMVEDYKSVNSLFSPLSISYKDAVVSGMVKEDGIDLYKVELKALKKVEFFDVKTGLLVKSQQTQSTPQGDMLTTSVFKDYKEFGGIKFPTKMITEAGPQVIEVTISSIELNKGVADKDFN